MELLQAGEVFSMHQVRSREPREFEESKFALRDLAQYAEQEKGDQRDGVLNAHGVLGTADEMGDFQGLLHRPEEQFDLPEHVPKKLLDFFDQDMLQLFDFELRPFRSRDST